MRYAAATGTDVTGDLQQNATRKLRSPFTYATDLARDEVDILAPPVSPTAGRTLVYESPDGMDYIHFSFDGNGVYMTIFGNCWNLHHALTHVEGRLGRILEMKLEK